jgi:hypothetical protein
LLTSGTTAYLPNPSQVAVADTWHGPYEILGNPHPKDTTSTSYHSQISSVFKVVGKKDLYIACADRWVPQLMDLRYEDYAQTVARAFSGEMTERERLEISPALSCDDKNTSVSDYVWLPLHFKNGMPVIDWLEEWRIQDYE